MTSALPATPVSAIQKHMSRYRLEPLNQQHNVFVGWDPVLNTYYGQVLPHTECDSFDLVLWIGTGWEEVTDIEELIEQIVDHAEIPSGVISSLISDKASTTTK